MSNLATHRDRQARSLAVTQWRLVPPSLGARANRRCRSGFLASAAGRPYDEFGGTLDYVDDKVRPRERKRVDALGRPFAFQHV